MEKDEHITEVVFRKLKGKNWGESEGDIEALMPYLIDNSGGQICCSCYAHVGQHGSADYTYMISRSVPATPEEYEPLKKEMESLFSYNLKVIQKVSGPKERKAIEEYFELQKQIQRRKGWAKQSERP